MYFICYHFNTFNMLNNNGLPTCQMSGVWILKLNNKLFHNDIQELEEVSIYLQS